VRSTGFSISIRLGDADTDAQRCSGTARFDELAADIPLSLLCPWKRDAQGKPSTPLGCALDLIAGDRA
jgi:hypothetical protein